MHVDQLFHLAQVFMEFLVDVGFRVRVVVVWRAPGRVKIREGPIDEVKVQVIELQVGQGLLAGWDILLGVLVVPELGGDPQVIAADAAPLDRREGLPN